MGDERLVVEGHEGIETLEDREGDGKEERNVGEVRLERSLVRESVTRDSLSLHGPLETDVRSQDGDPGKGSEDGNGGYEVVENDETVYEQVKHQSQSPDLPSKWVVRTRRSNQISQSHKASGKGKGDVRDTSLGAPGKDLGSVSVTGETVEGSGSDVLVRVGSREGEDQDARVDNRGETLDSGRGD